MLIKCQKFLRTSSTCFRGFRLLCEILFLIEMTSTQISTTVPRIYSNSPIVKGTSSNTIQNCFSNWCPTLVMVELLHWIALVDEMIWIVLLIICCSFVTVFWCTNICRRHNWSYRFFPLVLVHTIGMRHNIRRCQF